MHLVDKAVKKKITWKKITGSVTVQTVRLPIMSLLLEGNLAADILWLDGQHTIYSRSNSVAWLTR
jgi:hypothetical protein